MHQRELFFSLNTTMDETQQQPQILPVLFVDGALLTIKCPFCVYFFISSINTKQKQQ